MTTPDTDSPAPAPDAPPPQSEDRLARLERIVRLQWVLLGGLGLLVATLAVVQMVSTVREGARAKAQLQLLQQIQADFGRNPDATRSILTDEDLHRLLREGLGQVRDAYRPLGDADLSDPNANLDAILGDTKPEPAE